MFLHSFTIRNCVDPLIEVKMKQLPEIDGTCCYQRMLSGNQMALVVDVISGVSDRRCVYKGCS